MQQVFGPILKEASELKINVQVVNWNKDQPSIEIISKTKLTKTGEQKQDTEAHTRAVGEKIKNLLPIIKIDKENVIYSKVCKMCCRRSKENHHSNDPTMTFSSIKCTIGADWEMIATILGYTGQHGTHFCPFCDIMLKDLQSGNPHASVILPKYKEYDKQNESVFNVRTIESMRGSAEQYINNGSVKQNAKSYMNCENIPLIIGEGPVLDHACIYNAFTSELGIRSVVCEHFRSNRNFIRHSSQRSKGADKQCNDGSICIRADVKY